MIQEDIVYISYHISSEFKAILLELLLEGMVVPIGIDVVDLTTGAVGGP